MAILFDFSVKDVDLLQSSLAFKTVFFSKANINQGANSAHRTCEISEIELLIILSSCSLNFEQIHFATSVGVRADVAEGQHGKHILRCQLFCFEIFVSHTVKYEQWAVNDSQYHEEPAQRLCRHQKHCWPDSNLLSHRGDFFASTTSAKAKSSKCITNPKLLPDVLSINFFNLGGMHVINMISKIRVLNLLIKIIFFLNGAFK